jgi:hypothetical protein
MSQRLVLGLLPVALGLVIGACADQSSFEPSTGNDPSLTPSVTRIEEQGKRGPGGGAGGLKKDH